MRTILMAAGILITFGFGALAQSARNVEIEQTIKGHLQAFVERDVDIAFSYAAPLIQQIFETPANFGKMVQRGYPMVWDPDQTRMLDLIEISGEFWQKVMITDKDGKIHLLAYRMSITPRGWKISGVQIFKNIGDDV
jgi:hypothetical protein